MFDMLLQLWMWFLIGYLVLMIGGAALAFVIGLPIMFIVGVRNRLRGDPFFEETSRETPWPSSYYASKIRSGWLGDVYQVGDREWMPDRGVNLILSGVLIAFAALLVVRLVT